MGEGDADAALPLSVMKVVTLTIGDADDATKRGPDTANGGDDDIVNVHDSDLGDSDLDDSDLDDSDLDDSDSDETDSDDIESDESDRAFRMEHGLDKHYRPLPQEHEDWEPREDDIYDEDSGQVTVKCGTYDPNRFNNTMRLCWVGIPVTGNKNWHGRVVFIGPIGGHTAIFRCPAPGGRSRAIKLSAKLKELLGGSFGMEVLPAVEVPKYIRTDLPKSPVHDDNDVIQAEIETPKHPEGEEDPQVESDMDPSQTRTKTDKIEKKSKPRGLTESAERPESSLSSSSTAVITSPPPSSSRQ